MDRIKVYSTGLVHAKNSDSLENGNLKDYKASINLKEIVIPSHFESHRLSVHIIFLVVAKTMQNGRTKVLVYIYIYISCLMLKL